MSRRIAAVLLSAFLIAGCSSGLSPGAGPQPAPPPDTPAPPPTEAPASYDLVIRNGLIVDGTGKARFTGDVAIKGDRIAAVGRLGPNEAKTVIDAKGMVVAPGFINPHSHTHDYINPFEDLDATASLMQGITTEIGGVDGRSPVPTAAELSRLEKAGTGVNFGLFAGQGSIRAAVMKEAGGPANPQQLAEMKQMVREAMEAGAFGLSTGLEYRVGSHAATAEIAALAAEIKPYNGIYSTHMRSEGDRIVESLKEALSIGKTAGVPVNLSHFKIVHYRNWDKEDQVVRLIEDAISQGQKVFADVYPYLSPDYGINKPLADWYQQLPPEYLVITQAADAAIVGKTVKEAAAALNLPAAQAAERLLAIDPTVRVVALVSSESAMVRFYKAAWSVVSTDGESQPKLNSPAEALSLALHRRSYGSYPMLLGHYVRERQIMGLEPMVRKMTGLVADNLGIADRGYLKPGQFADIVVFDPSTVADRTTWLRPQEYPAGIQHVLVNGEIAVQDGERVQGRPGRVLRHGK